jgi:hypothetical protein
MIYINPDFRLRLEEVRRRDDWRLFRWIPAGPYWLSIQASGKHHCAPREILRAVEDYDRWEVDVLQEDGSWVTPRTHPYVFVDPMWARYWAYWAPSVATVPATGRNVPTEVVQTFYDFLVLGPELYREMIARGAS